MQRTLQGQIGHVVEVQDAGHTVYRVEVTSPASHGETGPDGQPVRECSMCGLGVGRAVVADHARSHGVRVPGAPSRWDHS